ncbi:hypothetical protein LUZ60_007904 [Juncus effusus]|nr:hypothetical protein LUZ60_007904 [Juncus effusus]
MGCTSSKPNKGQTTKEKEKRRKSKSKRRSLVAEVAVFVPAVRVPLPVDLVRPFRGLISKELLEKISAVRSNLVQLSEENHLVNVERIKELQKSLEEYLPLLLGLTNKEKKLESLAEFKWRSLEDDEECGISNAWYEILSVVHAMAMLCLMESNLMLLSNEDSKKDVVDLLLKASGCLDYCVHNILINIPIQIRKNLPSNLQQGTLEAISIQALAQGVEMQLGLASESDKASLSVKRRLACELVAYFSQAHYILLGCDTSDSYGKKLLLFIKWKFLEAKAAAYYYHGLTVDKSNEPNCHVSAVYCLCAAEDLLTESKRVSLSFCLSTPLTRVPPAWGVMKSLCKKIPDVANKRSQMYAHLFEQHKNNGLESLPDLPEFELSLRPDPFELPNADPLWDSDDCGPHVQSLKDHIQDDADDESSTEL